MNKNLIIAVAIFGIFLVGVVLFRMKSTEKPAENNAAMSPNTPSPVAGEVFGVYTGDLPCADCEGIDTVLTLYKDETYSLSNTYRGRDVDPYIEKGKWTTLRGDGTNPDATVYQLYTDNPDTEQNYLLEGDILKQLDKDMKPIEAPFNTSLTKKSS